MMISDVYRTLWRHRVLVLLVMCTVVATVFVLTSRQTKLYTASSLVRVQQVVQREDEVFGALLTGERLARTYERIAETDSVRELVDAELRGNISGDDLVIDAKQLNNLELIQIAVTDSDPELAAAVANEVPAALASFIKETGTFRDTITVVERASEPTTPSSPNVTLNLALAVMLGLILSGGLALLKESFSDRINDVEEAEAVTRHPVIATIPNLKFAKPVRGAPPSSGPRRVEPIRTAPGEVSVIEPAEDAGPAARWSARG